MMAPKPVDTVLDLIGRTPVVRLQRLAPPGGAAVFAKLESYNPGGSVKDRIALSMIEAAERDGRLRPGTVIVEPTSGNTGIGLAMVAAVKGYRLILTMPDTMSLERRSLLELFGAEVVLTPGSEGMRGAVAKAQELVRELGDAFMPQQFENPANPQMHRETTALEVLEQMEGRLDALVVGVGTGGTITGVGEVLKEHIPHLKIYAVEPASSPVLRTGRPGPHRIQGIGADFVPPVLNLDVVDEIIGVRDVDAFVMARRLAAKEGILAGISAGAAAWAALRVAESMDPSRRVLAVFPDTGERYLSMAPYFLVDLPDGIPDDDDVP